jgi:hypothetical protein
MVGKRIYKYLFIYALIWVGKRIDMPATALLLQWFQSV